MLARRRETELKLGHLGLRDATGLQLNQCSLAGGILHQDVMKVLRGKPVQPEDGPFGLALPAPGDSSRTSRMKVKWSPPSWQPQQCQSCFPATYIRMGSCLGGTDRALQSPPSFLQPQVLRGQVKQVQPPGSGVANA